MILGLAKTSPLALEIIRKHNYNLSGDTNQEANRKLKVIAGYGWHTDEYGQPWKREHS